MLFVETATIADGYTEDKDILLGTVDAVTADLEAVTFIEGGVINLAGAELKAGTKGTFVLRVLNAKNNVLGTNTITVDVK